MNLGLSNPTSVLENPNSLNMFPVSRLSSNLFA